MEDTHETLRLVAKAKSGDSRALELLLQRYLPRVHMMVRLSLGSVLRSRIESMDVVQEVMSRVLKSFDRFDVRHEAAFLHWVRTLVQNEIKNQAAFHGAARRDGVKEVVVTNETENPRSVLDGLAADTTGTPSQRLSHKDDLDELAGAMQRLPEEQREVIFMRQYEELSFKEMGEILSCSEDAARMKFVRAMDKLTDEMTGSM